MPTPVSLRQALSNDPTTRRPFPSLVDTPCSECGEPTSWPESSSATPCVCGRCREKALIAELRTDAIRHRIERSGLTTGRLAHMRFSFFERKTPTQRTAYNTVTSWFRSDKPQGESVLLWSPAYGTGKTHLAISTLYATLHSGHLAIFWFLADLLAAFRQSYNHPEAPGEEYIIGKAMRTPLLLIDDFRQEHVPRKSIAWFQERMSRIIDARWKKALPLLMTSNIRPTELKAYLGGASTSRLLEMVGPRIVDMSGPDYRLRRQT